MAEHLKIVEDERSDVEKAIDNWNILARAIGVSRVVLVTDDRKKALKKILALAGLEGWNRALENIEATPEIHQPSGVGKYPNWRVNFDFLLIEKNFVRMYELRDDDD